MFSSNPFHTLYTSTSNLFTTAYENFATSSTFETFQEYHQRTEHAYKQVLAAEQSGILYKAAPAALGVYVGYTALQKLKTAILGYDKSEFKKDFRMQALNSPDLKFRERVDLYAQGLFGSMSRQKRAYLLAEVASRAVLAAFLISPLFAKDWQEIPNFDNMMDYDQKSNKIAAAASGATHEHHIRAYHKIYTGHKDQYGRHWGGAKDLWKQSLSSGEIPKESQQLANDIFGVNTGEPTIKENLQDVAARICNWTVGFTPYSDTCDAMKPNLAKSPLFYTTESGGTAINTTVLDKQFLKAKALVNSGKTLSNEAILQTKVESVCGVLGSIQQTWTETLNQISQRADTWLHTQPKQISLKPTYYDVMQPYQCPKAVAATAAAPSLCYQFALSSRIFTQPQAERNAHLFFIQDAYKALKQRSEVNPIFASSPLSGTFENQIQQMHHMAENVASMTSKQGEGFVTSLENAALKTPQSILDFTRNFFNISNDIELNPKTVHASYKTLSKVLHPDKCVRYPHIKNCQDQLTTIHKSLSAVDEVVKKFDLSKGVSRFYSPVEFANRLFHAVFPKDV